MYKCTDLKPTARFILINVIHPRNHHQIKIKNTFIPSESWFIPLCPAPRSNQSSDFYYHRLVLSVLDLHINGLSVRALVCLASFALHVLRFCIYRQLVPFYL